MTKALLVIDMQEICVGNNHAKNFKYDCERLIESVNGIIEHNHNADNTVVYILNIMKKNLINKFAPFQVYDNSPESALVNGLKIVSDNKFVKYKGDAFSNPDLDKFLKANSIDTVEVVGVDGGACIPMTALGAVRNGYKVIVNTNGIGTTFIKRKEKYDIKLKQLDVEFR